MVFRLVLIFALVCIVLIVAAGILVWRSMGKPFYNPGMVRDQQNLRAPLAPPPQAGEPDYWNVERDIRIHYFSSGGGEPVLVLHGGPGFPFQEPFPVLEPLRDQYKFYYYDQRGCGKSTKPFDRFESSNYYQNMKTLEQTLGIGAQVADVERIRRLLKQEKLILVGHSFGGFLASMYAAEFPEHVKGLVLIAPASVLVLPGKNGGLFEAIRAKLPEAMKHEYDGFLKRYFDFGSLFSQNEAKLAEMNREVGRFFLIAAGEERSESIKQDRVNNGGWMVQAMYLSMGKEHDYREALKRVSSPVLIIHGENDLISVEASQQYADAFPHATLDLLKGAGHLTFTKTPSGFADTVRKFLGELH